MSSAADVEEQDDKVEDGGDSKDDSSTLADVEQLGLWAAIASLSYVFWICGGMEMIERLAYYGVRAVTPLYFKRPVSEGALGVGTSALGPLFFAWAAMQSIVPIFTGGISDRYGYKQTIAVSTALKISGYVVMALFHTYAGFFMGAMLLAFGTAVFKPGIQGTLVKSTNRKNSSMAWGIFYQTVNIGGWIGPLIALAVRSRVGWTYIFYVNAAFICVNFLLLLTYKEPDIELRLARREKIKKGEVKEQSLALESLKEFKKPVLLVYMLIFSVWWFMFPMLWDVLPAFVDDWVDTSVLVNTIFGEGGTRSGVFHFLLGMNAEGTIISAEGIVNINALIIMLTCFLFAGLSAKMRATTSMVVGTVLVTISLLIFGYTNLAWFGVLAMVIFSIGEMLASPKFSEFLGNIAPADKKAMWLGFSQFPIAIGWMAEGYVGPRLYSTFADKDSLAREMLQTKGLSAEQVSDKALPIGEAFKKLVEVTGETPHALTQHLYETHSIGLVWYVFAVVGVVSGVMIYLYGRWILKLAKAQMKEKARASAD